MDLRDAVVEVSKAKRLLFSPSHILSEGHGLLEVTQSLVRARKRVSLFLIPAVALNCIVLAFVYKQTQQDFRTDWCEWKSTDVA
jgi:hypothetical protein